MNKTGAWVLAAVGASAAAGVATGFATCRLAHAPTEVELQAADRETAEQLHADLDLRREQVEVVRAILRAARDEEAQIYSRNHTRFPPEIQDELAKARRKADVRIQFLLDPEQRTRYDRLRGYGPKNR